MATARELCLRKGDVVRLGTNIYEAVPCWVIEPTREESYRLLSDPSLYDRLPRKLSFGTEGRGLDMTRGARVEVLRAYVDGSVDVRYLDDVRMILIKDGKTTESVENRSIFGLVGSIWNGYVGFIPESLERKELVPETKN